MLLAAPNFSEGRDPGRIAALRAALDGPATVLDRHSDAAHHRTVISVAGEGRPLIEALASAAQVAIDRIDMRRHRGLHPCVGALDVCPLVWLREEDRSEARTRAMSVVDRVAARGVPVFLYGELASDEERRERAFFRRGGLEELTRRMAAGEVRPDAGPPAPHPSAGATLVTARPPLAAFNLEIDTPDVEIARRIAAELRESSGGLRGVRAIGLPLEGERSQVSANVHDPISVPLRELVERAKELAAPFGVRPVEAELVGLVPEAALEGYPVDVPIRNFDPDRHVIELRVGPSGGSR